MSTDVCEICGGPISVRDGTEFCAPCLAAHTLKFLEDPSPVSPITTLSKAHGTIKFGDYEVLEELARGGMGVVYRARRQSTSQIVALKFIHSGPVCSLRTEARFMTEIEAVATLSHPHIVPILDVDTKDELPFYTMRLIEGGSLANLEGRRFDLSALRKSVECLAKVAKAVHFAHEHGIIHRDLKPSNVLLDEAGEPYVSDFGLAKRLDGQSDLTLTGEMLGTPSFMAPEQVTGSQAKQTIAVDVYSLGAILYHSITGKAPFSGSTAFETLKRIESHEVRPPSQIRATIDRDLETIVLKCLEKEASRRYSSALALLEDLQRWLSGRPVVARRTPWWERVRKWSLRQPYAATAVCVTLTLLVLLGMQTLSGIQRSQQEQTRIRNLSDRLGESLTSGRLQLADRLLQTGQRGEALAHVAAIVRDRTSKDTPLSYLKNLVEGQGFAWRMTPPLVHSNSVWNVDFHPDGDRVATASNDGRGRIWSLQSPNSPLHELSHETVVYQIDFNASGSRVVTGSYDHTARVWDVESGEPISPHLRLPGSVQIARFIGEDDRYVLVCGGAAVRVWDTHSFERPHSELVVPASEALIHIGSSIPGADERLLLGSVTGSLWLWDWSTGEVIERGHSGARYISDCVVSPDGKRFLALSDVDTIALWSTDSLTPITRLKHSDAPWSVGFSEDRGTFVTATREGYNFWDTETGNPLIHRNVLSTLPELSQGATRMPTSIRDDLWFPYSYHSVFVFEPSGRPAAIPSISFSRGITGVVPDPHNQRVAVRTGDHHVHVCEYSKAPSQSLVYRTPDDFVANRSQFLAVDQGQSMLSLGAHGEAELQILTLGVDGNPRPPISLKRNYRLREFWNPQSTRLLLTRDFDSTARALKFDHEMQGFEPIFDGTDGKLLAISSDDQWGVVSYPEPLAISLVSLSEPNHVRRLPGGKDKIRLRFSPDSRFVIGIQEDGRVALWDVNECEVVREIDDVFQFVEAFDCARDTSRLSLGYRGGVLALWQLFPRKQMLWDQLIEDGIRVIVHSADDRWIAVGTQGGKVLVLDASTGRLLSNPIVRQAAIVSLHFTPDSASLMVGSRDQTLGFWDPRSGFPLAETFHYSGDRLSVDLSPDGHWFCFGVDEDTIEVHRVPSAVSFSGVPSWFVPFSEAAAGFRLGSNDLVELIPWEERSATMDAVRAMDPGEPLVGWAQSVMGRGQESIVETRDE